jgi:lysozyme family protein
MASFEISQKIVGLNEGGYQNLADDSGNWYKGILIGTNWGIAAPTLARFLGRTPTVSDMKNLPRSTAETILKRNYWLKNHFDQLKNQSVATMLYDGAVNHGVGGILSITKKALTKLKHPISKVFTADGIGSLNKLNQRDLFFALKEVRTERYKASPKKKYLKGWLTRLERIKYAPESNVKDIILGLALLVSGIALFLLGL